MEENRLREEKSDFDTAQWGGLRVDKQGRCPCTPAKAEGLWDPIAAGAFRNGATFGRKVWWVRGSEAFGNLRAGQPRKNKRG